MKILAQKIAIVTLFLFTSQVRAQYVNIPDVELVNWLNNNGFASCMNGSLMDTTCSGVVNTGALYITNANITYTDGLQYFDNATALVINKNYIALQKEFLPPKTTFLVCSYANNSLAIYSLPDSLQFLDISNSTTYYSISAFPSTLTELYCFDTFTSVALPTLPASLRVLNCRNNYIPNLPTLPPSLEILDCGNTYATALPALPSTLTSLDCDGNQLTSLPALPATLTILNCDRNQITALPSLPPSLEDLGCSFNQLTSIPVLPGGLKRLICNHNQISSYPTFPNTLEFLNCKKNPAITLPNLATTSLHYLYCDSSQFTTLPALPSVLREIHADYGQMTSLPTLPDSLVYLSCKNHQLTSLPALPDTLKDIICNHNLLTAMPTLPSYLNRLICNNNLLTALPVFPPALKYLDCGFNQLTSLPDFPDTVIVYSFGNNPIACLPELKKASSLNFMNTNITCKPNVGNVAGSNPWLGYLPLCQPSGNCFSIWNINGNIFNDLNADCLNNSEDNLKNVGVNLDSAGIIVQKFYTDHTGDYTFRTGYGNYTVSIDTASLPFNVTCPVSFNQTTVLNAANPADSTLDFGLECKPGFDLLVKPCIANGILRPGVQRKLWVPAGSLQAFYGSHCGGSIAGTVELTLTGPVTYVGPDVNATPPTSVVGNVITWNVSDFLTPGLNFDIIIAIDTTATTSGQVCTFLSITPVAGDVNPLNNITNHCIPVRNSFDPNEKYMYPSGNVDSTQQWFTFTVNFQNTGNAPAEDIYILDTLSNNLDASTFSFLNSSHDLISQLLPGNILRFNFPDINLADSTSDEPASHGFVLFKVKRKNNLPVGTTISNTACIYFDFNPAVVTNTVSATLSIPTSIQTITGNTFDLFPNPSAGNFKITYQLPKNNNGQLEIFDLAGKKVYKQILPAQSRSQIISVADLQPGMYSCVISSADGRSVKKLLLYK